MWQILQLIVGDRWGQGEIHRKHNIIDNLLLLCARWEYLSPQMMGGPWPVDGFKSDCWSMGVLFYEILMSSLPWTFTGSEYNQQDMDRARQIVTGRNRYTLTRGNPIQKYVIHELLKVDLTKRMSSKKALIRLSS